MIFDEREDYSVSLDEAAKMTARYRQQVASSDTISVAVSKPTINSILIQGDCIGARIYFARNDEGRLMLILVGIKENGDDIYNGQIAEWSPLCPPFCPRPNPLNS